MTKITGSYSKKLPTEARFSSESVFCSIEKEIGSDATASEIQRAIAETFELVRDSVESELTIGRGAQRPRRREERPHDRRDHDNGRGTDQRCTNRQVQFILRLGQEQNLGLPELNRKVAELYEAGNVYDLSKRDASAFVDVLKAAA
ncbi:hypothetical protein PDESU_04284 [Pontiella desulfatans]|uniref:Uncharacterized protein n=1 Tax=Pontiella desulfatans TaxID=2750659 RepID=A0A6C2U287_PONDE|nr:hypothetical protein [Pontiella desulfatans]VGO14102.1 hypothetical protein PDESU_02659 [Pontiella desulfatans]VGO15699.1 hypothetical protein PDESU_04284 [Pontiella desulfatans]